MPAIPLGQSDYQRADAQPLTLRNMYFEKSPTNAEDQVSIRSRQRLRQFAAVGAGPIRGMFRKGNVLANAGLSGQLIVRSADTLYRVHQTTGVATLIDVMEGPGRISAEGNEDVVVLAGGTKLYSTDGTALTQITFPDGKFVWAVDSLSGYFIFTSELGRFYWSAPGGTTVSALDYATAESQPDTLLTHKVIGDELWLFGRYSIEPWQPTGDADLPFQRIGGRIFGIGITARETCQKLSLQGLDVVCWVGTDRRVYRTDPNPKEISDAAMVARLNKVSDPSVLYATLHSTDGHDFYVLHLPEGLGSWAYDLSTDTWAEYTSYGLANWRVDWGTVGPNNQTLLGDNAAGIIWELTDDDRDDAGDPVQFQFSGVLRVTGSPQRCNNVRLDITTGLTPDPENDPMIGLEVSDDKAGLIWESMGEQPLGRQGEYVDQVMWTQLGLLQRPARNLRWTTTEPVTVEGAAYNEPFR